MRNSTENSSQLSSQCFLFEVVSSSQDFMNPINIVTALINGIFAVVSTLGNSLIVYAIWKNNSLQTPSNVLLSCLAFSDFVVGLLAQPAFVVHKIGELVDNFNLYCITRVTTETVGQISSGVSTLTLVAISVERYLALRLNLRYKVVVTNCRIFTIVGCFWAFFTVATISKLFVAKIYAYYGALLFFILIFSFVVIFVSYIYIFRYVLKHQNQIHSVQLAVTNTTPGLSTKPRMSISILRYKKATLTMAFILGVYLLFYAPFLVVLIARRFFGYTRVIKAAYVCTSTLVLLNSSANPAIYCWRIEDIRVSVKHILKKLFPSCFSVARNSVERSTAFNMSRVQANSR